MIDTGDTRVQLEVKNAIATITIARPEKLNALDFDMIKALEHAAHLIDASEQARVAIITGQGVGMKPVSARKRLESRLRSIVITVSASTSICLLYASLNSSSKSYLLMASADT